jgi:small subunit ribosomal protein S13e
MCILLSVSVSFSLRLHFLPALLSWFLILPHFCGTVPPLPLSSLSFQMGRMHTPGKGIARSALPYRRTPPHWFKLNASEVVGEIVKHARKGLTPSQIGVLLRDSFGVPQVKAVTGNKILRILKQNGAFYFRPLSLRAT